MTRFLILLLLISLSISSSFILKEENTDYSIISLNIGEISFEDNENYKLINSTSLSKTQNIGQPELPTYTANYAIEYEKDYSVELVMGNYILIKILI